MSEIEDLRARRIALYEALDDNKQALALAVQTAYADGQSIRELAAEYGTTDRDTIRKFLKMEVGN